jgi:hypothetical protein
MYGCALCSLHALVERALRGARALVQRVGRVRVKAIVTLPSSRKPRASARIFRRRARGGPSWLESGPWGDMQVCGWAEQDAQARRCGAQASETRRHVQRAHLFLTLSRLAG